MHTDAMQLLDVGMDVEFLIWELNEVGLATIINSEGAEWVTNVSHAFLNEPWDYVHFK